MASMIARCFVAFWVAAAAAVAARDWTPIWMLARSGVRRTSPLAVVTICGMVGRLTSCALADAAQTTARTAPRSTSRFIICLRSRFSSKTTLNNIRRFLPAALDLDHQVLQIGSAHPRHAPSLRKRGGSNARQLLARFGRE